MITIKTIDYKYGGAEIHIAKNTPHITMLLGIEMLIEALMKEATNEDIDSLLEDIKRIYERDNKKEEIENDKDN